MRTTQIAEAAAMLTFGACTKLANPGYAPPTDGEAKSGYIAGQHADAAMIEGKPIAKASEFPNEAVREVVARSHAWDEFRDTGTIEALRSTSAIDRVTATNCQWRRIDADEVEKFSEPRLSNNPPGAFYCDVEEFVTQQYGIKAKASTKGYFYKAADGWMYVGKYAHGFERI